MTNTFDNKEKERERYALVTCEGIALLKTTKRGELTI